MYCSCCFTCWTNISLSPNLCAYFTAKELCHVLICLNTASVMEEGKRMALRRQPTFPTTDKSEADFMPTTTDFSSRPWLSDSRATIAKAGHGRSCSALTASSNQKEKDNSHPTQTFLYILEANVCLPHSQALQQSSLVTRATSDNLWG